MSRVKMLKRPFHDLIEIKRKVAKLEKSKSAKTDKKCQRTLTISSSSDEEPTGSQSKCVKRTEAPMPETATSSREEPKKAKSLAKSSSRRKTSEANASRDGNKEPKSLTGHLSSLSVGHIGRVNRVLSLQGWIRPCPAGERLSQHLDHSPLFPKIKRDS